MPMPRDLNLRFTNTTKSSPSINHSRPFSNPSPTLLIKNFNSLYDATTASATSDSDSEPDIATAFASKRFFFSSPGLSNSIIDSTTSSSLASTSSSSVENDAAEGSITVSTYSPDPYVDFRSSMQEMVEARQVHDVGENWDYLHQLLMCYLSLNPKSTHKFIVGAFADLVVSLTEKSCRRNGLFNGKRKVSMPRI